MCCSMLLPDGTTKIRAQYDIGRPVTVFCLGCGASDGALIAIHNPRTIRLTLQLELSNPGKFEPCRHDRRSFGA
jgi:hypothetical protein